MARAEPSWKTDDLLLLAQRHVISQGHLHSQCFDDLRMSSEWLLSNFRTQQRSQSNPVLRPLVGGYQVALSMLHQA